jgi:signal transduction histidine kinase
LIADVLPRLWERRPEEGRQRLDDLRRLTRGALREMRTLLLELRPDGPGEFALGELLRQLTDTMTALVQVPVSLVASGALPPMPAAVHLALYRIAQEALNNAARHAHASQITVHLRGEPDLVEVLVRDDGRGFDPARVADGHLGLGIMRERAASVGATMTIDSQTGQGTRVAVVWPVLGREDRS